MILFVAHEIDVVVAAADGTELCVRLLFIVDAIGMDPEGLHVEGSQGG